MDFTDTAERDAYFDEGAYYESMRHYFDPHSVDCVMDECYGPCVLVPTCACPTGTSICVADEVGSALSN